MFILVLKFDANFPISNLCIFMKWAGAIEGCCSIGMTILSIDNDYEYSNLIAAMNSTTNKKESKKQDSPIL